MTRRFVPDLSQYLTPTQAAARYNVWPATLYNAMNDGRLPFFKAPPGRRIAIKDLEVFILKLREKGSKA